ncbi:MAG: hypothetical protein OH316_00975 [Candidatus Parvarchaeota archaeon]|nr:hypothetical protein [Candidatus Parvarchaeota archaeon]MCW1301694.1 hypothetical protein [Candidatus Parvarchaeota archaeon]
MIRYKKRYILAKIPALDSVERLRELVYSTVNRFEPTLGIRSNLKVIDDVYLRDDDGLLGVIRVNNRYKYQVIFTLSLMERVFPFNLITLSNSGSLKKLKGRLKEYGTIAK